MDTDSYNRAVSEWARGVYRALKSRTKVFTHGKSGGSSSLLSGRTELKLASSLGRRTKKVYGEIEMVGFTFERHGVFVAKGVGKGYKMVAGQVMRTAGGPAVSVRVPKDWFNPVINARIMDLADIAANYHADMAVEEMREKIKIR